MVVRAAGGFRVLVFPVHTFQVPIDGCRDVTLEAPEQREKAEAAGFGVEGAELLEEGFEGVAGPAEGTGAASVSETITGGDALAFEGFGTSGFHTVGTGGGFSGFGDHFRLY